MQSLFASAITIIKRDLSVVNVACLLIGASAAVVGYHRNAVAEQSLATTRELIRVSQGAPFYGSFKIYHYSALLDLAGLDWPSYDQVHLSALEAYEEDKRVKSY